MIDICKCFGPLASAVMNGRLMSVDWAELNSFLAFSQASCQPLQGHVILAEVDALLALELLGNVVDEDFVEVVATEVGIAVGRDDAEHAVGHFEDGDVERTAAEVEDADRFFALAVEAVGERCGRRLVDDAGDFETGDLAGVFGCLALGVVEVGRHGDDGFVHLVAEICFCGFLELAQNHRRDFGWRVFLVADADLHVIFRAADDLSTAPFSLRRRLRCADGP